MNFIDILYTQVLPVVLFLIMAGLGLSLTPADFKRIVRFPKAFSIGLAAQMVAMPALAFLLAYLLAPTPAIAVGLIILAACPSGVTANAYSFAARADLALCVSLSAVTSILVVFTLPALTYLGLLAYYEQGQMPSLPALAFIRRLVTLTILPVVIGMSARAIWPALTQKLIEPLRRVTMGVLVFVLVAAALSSYEVLLEHMASAGLLVVTMNVVSMGMGYGLARLFRLPMRQAVTITFEIGVQNLALALLITLTVLREPELAIASLLYAVVMPLTAIAFVAIGKRLILASGEDLSNDPPDARPAVAATGDT